MNFLFFDVQAMPDEVMKQLQDSSLKIVRLSLTPNMCAKTGTT